MRKSLYDISWQVSEYAYRMNSGISYSTISRFHREGFDNLDRLFDKIETPSLTFGSAVDSLITGGEEEFNERFIVADFPTCPEAIVKIVEYLHDADYVNLEDIPDSEIISATELFKYQLNWKPETRAKVIKEKGSEYYKLMHIREDKSIIDSATYKDIMATVDALRSSEATSWYFEKDNPFDTRYERFYQLKFKSSYNGIPIRCMADLIIVDHEAKEIIPVDLKTSSKPEWSFFKSFIDWCYYMQANLYYKIIEDNIKNDDYFKDFVIKPYRFIVVNRKTLCPLVWEYNSSHLEGDIVIGDVLLKDWRKVLTDLNYYLTLKPLVPKGINEYSKINNIETWIANECKEKKWKH